MLQPDPDAPAPPPVFAEPWQASAFAMAVALHERGLFTWPEWAAELARNVTHTPGEDYYSAWLQALETLLAERGVAQTSEVDSLAEAWRRAANATPHGKPILLENDPQRR